MSNPSHWQSEIESIYRDSSKRVYASLVRMLRDFDLAEEATQEAFSIAVDCWRQDGIPENPTAWLISTGRFKAIDTLRRQGRLDALTPVIARHVLELAAANRHKSNEPIEDDRLRLIFACCHPAIDPAVQLPLTLREVCGLTTEQISAAFMVNPSTMAQRIVRGKAKIRDAGIPISIPDEDEFHERLDSVLAVVYLVFNEGYSASSGEQVTRTELSAEAIRLCRLLVQLAPEAETIGLLALMLLHESRRTARTNQLGDIVLLEDQDRSCWDTTLISEGLALIEQALRMDRVGVYSLQAAIAAVHASAPTAELTDWPQILALYSALYSINSSPVVELNRAVAVAMVHGPDAGLQIVNAILERGELTTFHLAYATQADLLRRLGRTEEARHAYRLALSLAQQAPERRFLAMRMEEL
ncbi:MAG: RNA polymerase sigma factor [Planctomycetales bacterium]|nr:RNA polymerase sigma factor [Planctomycetales bacterium]